MNVLEIQDLFICEAKSRWDDTPLRDFFHLSPKAKGLKGEKIAAELLRKLGHSIVFDAPNNGGYDMTVDGKKPR